jgi:hypothetical protein
LTLPFEWNYGVAVGKRKREKITPPATNYVSGIRCDL